VIGLWARLRQSFLGRPLRQLRVRETLALGDKRQLLIVECGERQLLIGAAGNFLTMLAELPVAEHTTSETTCE
jgi:flagellar biogenesis protein FliO